MAAGFDAARFWEICPREVQRELRAAAQLREREYNERVWLSWHTAAFQRIDKLPKLETLFIRAEAPRPRQTGEQMLAAMKGMFLAFGGDPAELGLKNEPGTDR